MIKISVLVAMQGFYPRLGVFYDEYICFKHNLLFRCIKMYIVKNK